MTIKNRLVDTNAYKLQPSVSERVIVDRAWSSYSPTYISVSKLKKTKTVFLRCTGYLNSIKNPVKQDLLLILVLVRQQNFINCGLQLKSMLSSTVKRYKRDPVKTHFGLLKIQVKF